MGKSIKTTYLILKPGVLNHYKLSDYVNVGKIF